MKDGEKTRIEMFTGSKGRQYLNHHHHICIPVYVLNNDLQLGRKISKWDARARVGIYLGKSPQHRRNVSLVLKTNSGMVSPQYHLLFDDTFETV
jgi:hypothetical protein